MCDNCKTQPDQTTEKLMVESFQVLRKRINDVRRKFLFGEEFSPEDMSALEMAAKNFGRTVGLHLQFPVFDIED